jgi:hypothetical protein
MKVKLYKLSDCSDPEYPNHIQAGYVTEGMMLKEPIVNECFYVGSLRTSLVQEIIDEFTFKTVNSIYRYESVASIRNEKLEKILN